MDLLIQLDEEVGAKLPSEKWEQIRLMTGCCAELPY